MSTCSRMTAGSNGLSAQYQRSLHYSIYGTFPPLLARTLEQLPSNLLEKSIQKKIISYCSISSLPRTQRYERTHNSHENVAYTRNSCFYHTDYDLLPDALVSSSSMEQMIRFEGLSEKILIVLLAHLPCKFSQLHHLHSMLYTNQI